MTSNKFISIAETTSNKMRVYVSDAVLLDIQSLYVEFDIENLRIRAVNGATCGKGNVRKLSGRQQMVFSNIPNQSALIGKYNAVRQVEGEWWILEKIPQPPLSSLQISQKPKWSGRLSFPEFDNSGDFFKVK